MSTRKPVTTESIYNALPTSYKKEDKLQKPTAHPLKRFLELMGPGWDYLEDRIKGLESLYDPDTTPSIFLDDLASMWGFQFPVSKVAASTGKKVRSGTVHPTGMNIDNVMNSVRSLSLNTVSLPVRLDFKDLTDPYPSLDNVHLDAVISIGKTLNANNVNVILEMTPFVAGALVRGDVLNPSNVDVFFSNWKTHMTRVLRVMEAEGLRVSYFNVASDLSNLETAGNSPRWTEMFESVRSLYKGRIMYRTKWWSTGAAHTEKLNLPFFSSPFLDVIAITAYFELTDSQQYTKDELVACLTTGTTLEGRGQQVYNEIKAFYDTHSKPIYLGELGVGGNEWGAARPWDPATTSSYDGTQTGAVAYPDGQKFLFEAYEDVFAGNSWFLGFSAYQVTDVSSPYYPVAKPVQGAIANFFDLGTPSYNISLTESEKRQFLDLLPTLYAYKSSRRVFTFLGRYVFGSNTAVTVDRIDRLQASTGFNTIDLGVTVSDDVLNLGEMSTRYLLFAENFRPVNHKLNVTFTIVYYESYDSSLRKDNEDTIDMTERTTETYSAATMNDTNSNDGLLTDDTESYTTSSTVDDSLHNNALQEVTLELYDGVQSDASYDIVHTLGSMLGFPNSANRLGATFRLSSFTKDTLLPTNTN